MMFHRVEIIPTFAVSSVSPPVTDPKALPVPRPTGVSKGRPSLGKSV